MHKILPTGNVVVLDLPNGIEVELKPLSRNQLRQMAAMDSALQLHRKKFEDNPDLLLDGDEFDRYVAREMQLQQQSDSRMLQMLICRWGKRDSITLAELQAESSEPVVVELLSVISEAEIIGALFRKSGTAPATAQGMDEDGVGAER
jgi:hypothetical protein